MAKQDKAPVEPPEDPTEAPADPVAPITGFLEKRPYKPFHTPKVAPRYAFECVVGLGGDDYVYHQEGVDEADCKAAIVATNQAFAAGLHKLRFGAKRLSWTPTNVAKLTVAQVADLAGLTDDEKLPLMEIAIQPEA